MEFTAQSGNDQRIDAAYNGSYPPPATGRTTGLSTNQGWNSKVFVGGSGYRGNEYQVKWDTSALPDDATITGATVTFRPTAATDGNANRSLMMDWGVWAGALSDWVSEGSGNAFGGRRINLFTVGTDVTLTLLNPAANVSTTGMTGLKFWISGGAPTAANDVNPAPSTGTGPPVLTVTYTEPAAGLQTIRVAASKRGTGANPTFDAKVYDGATLIDTPISGQAVSSSTPTVFEGTFDATGHTDAGALELEITSAGTVGALVEVDAADILAAWEVPEVEEEPLHLVGMVGIRGSS